MTTKRKTAAPKAAKPAAAPAPEPAAADPAAAGGIPRQTKRDQLIQLLQQPEGATLAELTAALGWLPHTVRSAITGLKKSGHAVERIKGEEGSSYLIPVFGLTAASPEAADAAA